MPATTMFNGRFSTEDGDRWFRRNRDALGTAVEHDWPLKLIEKHLQLDQRSSVLEVGCANGWRLAELVRRYYSNCLGMDVSAEAIGVGKKAWPELRLYRMGADVGREEWVMSTDWLASWPYSLVICFFVLHWVDRQGLIRAIENIHYSIPGGGHLIIGDFLPDWPTKVPYHHREGLWTYKLDYAHIFEATGNYRRIERVIFDHDTHQQGGMEIAAYKRCAVTLLRKEDCYEEGRGRA